ncbi:hypothetical protein V5799_016931 [Amblyomma americanum]|uniref:ABC transmembrane type-1 domain-containing protein n=1 Tax=Amblyomma americanum TaxID=6943 RepID=A0AAQ4F4W6_AMBAM
MTSRTRALYPAGRILSMLGVDCLQLCNLIFVASVPLVGFVTLPFVLWMLAARVGAVPALCCAAWMVLVLSLLFIVAPVQQRIWIRAQAAREERLKATSDLLSTIRVVKMYAWEDALQESVLRARLVEQKWLLRVNLLDAVLDSVYSSTSSVTSWQLLCALLRLGGWQGPLAVAAFCVAACALGWEQVWIKQWTDAAVTPQAAHASWVQGLLGLCVLDAGRLLLQPEKHASWSALMAVGTLPSPSVASCMKTRRQNSQWTNASTCQIIRLWSR